MEIKNAHREANRKAIALVQVRDNNDQTQVAVVEMDRKGKIQDILKVESVPQTQKNELMVAREKGQLRTLRMSCTHCYI